MNPPVTPAGAPYTLQLPKLVSKQLDKLSDKDAGRLFTALEQMCLTGNGDILKLKGRRNEYRLRVGEYRVFFEVNGRDVNVTNVERRSGTTY